MGNRIAKFTVCFSGAGDGRRRQRAPFLIDDPLDEGLGHSFCYVRPEPVSLSKVHSDETTTFRSISGAAVSANTSTPLSTAFVDKVAAAFESSDSFASIPLQPISRALLNSGPISDVFSGSGPIERGFLSGPIERGFMSGPLDRGLFSGPLDKSKSRKFQRSFSHGGLALRLKSRRGSLSRILKRAASKATYRSQNSIVAPIKKEPECVISSERSCENANLSLNLRREGSLNDGDSLETQNLQWAQGKAGEDRVHVVVSEEHGWVFVGIYDGFNGPDATDYLLTNLYSAVQRELKGLLWDDQFETSKVAAPASAENCDSEAKTPGLCECDDDKENHLCGSGDVGFDWNSRSEMGKNMRSKYRGAGKKWVDNQRRWRWQWERERIELDRRLKEHLSRSASNNSKVVNHEDVLKALSRALRKTEEAYLAIADKMVMENPELALMGSCVLVMLMKGEDVYVMNIGDSRAVLAQQAKPDYLLCKIRQDLERIKEETLQDLETADCDRGEIVPSLTAFQLSIDHSTSMKEEVQRIRNEHPDDACAVVNDRVKGSLKVTRAFGAGFLKQPKWNEALIEIFRVHYIGTSPYITCFPSLYHHRLGPNDRFLILSSDGLYQYFTNEEAVSEVELFISSQPEGDPAQHLVEEVLFRAAKKAGMDLGELLEIAQGDRRRYHDDLSIIVISLEGRIWRSCA